MSEFEKVIKEATEPKTEKKSYGEVVRERRASMNTITEEAYGAISKDRAAFVGMLNIASRFLRNSEGNILLIYGQNPNATELHSYGVWKEKGKTVKKGEKPVYIFKRKDYVSADGHNRFSFDPDPKYDVLSTVDGKPTPAPVFDDKILVRGIVHSSPVKIVVDSGYPQSNPEGAAYIEDKSEIRCKYGMPTDELVPTILNATALAEFCTANGDARPSDYEFKARCVAYILTAKYGISTAKIGIHSIPSDYQTMDPDRFKAEIHDLLETAKKIDNRIAEIIFRPKAQVKDAEKSNETVAQKTDEGKDAR